MRQHLTSNKSVENSIPVHTKTSTILFELYTPHTACNKCPKQTQALSRESGSPDRANARHHKKNKPAQSRLPFAFSQPPTAPRRKKPKLRAFARSGFPLSRERNHFFRTAHRRRKNRLRSKTSITRRNTTHPSNCEATSTIFAIVAAVEMCSHVRLNGDFFARFFSPRFCFCRFFVGLDGDFFARSFSSDTARFT